MWAHKQCMLSRSKSRQNRLIPKFPSITKLLWSTWRANLDQHEQGHVCQHSQCLLDSKSAFGLCKGTLPRWGSSHGHHPSSDYERIGLRFTNYTSMEALANCFQRNLWQGRKNPKKLTPMGSPLGRLDHNNVQHIKQSHSYVLMAKDVIINELLIPRQREDTSHSFRLIWHQAAQSVPPGSYRFCL